MPVRLYLILFLFLIGFTASAHTVVERDGYYEVEHEWEYKGRGCSIVLNISTNLYDYFQNDREHLAYYYQFEDGEVPPNYFSFMLSEYDRPVMHAIAEEFSRYVTSEEERANLALSFVQSLPYAYDNDSKDAEEYVRYPIETLVDGQGDCEDKVALLIALLYEMEADFVLLALPEHMAVGVHLDDVDAGSYLWFHNKRYYYMETTKPNWQIGQIPEHYRSAEMEVVPVNDTPSLLMKGVHFDSQPTVVNEKADCVINLDLHNLGPGKVTDVRLRVRIIEKGWRNRVLTDASFLLNDMLEGERRTETLPFKSLIKENCVLVLELTGEEVAPQSYELNMEYSKIKL